MGCGQRLNAACEGIRIERLRRSRSMAKRSALCSQGRAASLEQPPPEAGAGGEWPRPFAQTQNHQPKCPSTRPKKMNNTNPEVSPPDRQIAPAHNTRAAAGGDELSRLKRARATVTVAELDIKAINARIRELVK